MRKKILVCDDDPDIRRMLVLLLTPEFDVLDAADGQAALKLIAEKKPDLVLLDISMPGMDGLAVLCEYRFKLPRPLTIVLTGSTELGTARRALSLGAREYVTKPFEGAEIVAEVRRVLAEAERPARRERERPWRVVGGEAA
jgi:DNA-binding response OmpR family regulator